MELKANQLTMMEQETREIPFIVENQLHEYESLLKGIVSQINSSVWRTIVVCGRGSSQNACVFAKYLFETQLGLVTSISAPSVNSVFDANQYMSNTIFFVISQSGNSQDIIQAAKSAKESCALVIGLVNDDTSPLADVCDHVIPMLAGIEKSVAATKTFVASLSALLILVSKLKGKKSPPILVSLLPDYIRKCLDSNWNGLVEDLKDTNQLYVLGRGFGYSIAKEAALKLKETSQIHAEAFSSAEFVHGPMTILSHGQTILAFTIDDASYDPSNHVYEKLSKLGAKVLTISSKCTNVNYRLPSSPHILFESLGMITQLYLILAQVSKARGLNPDKPRNIHKVTSTT